MSGMDVLRERIARALYMHANSARSSFMWDNAGDDTRAMFMDDADAVIAALGLESEYQFRTTDDYQLLTECRYVTPWERIEEDG